MKPGDRYRPSNGTEGRSFESRYCDRCRHEDPDKDKWCHIHTIAMGCYTDDPEYPKEWTFTSTGKPTCTAFQAMPTPDEIEAEAERKRQASIQAENKRLEEQGQLSMFDFSEVTA